METNQPNMDRSWFPRPIISTLGVLLIVLVAMIIVQKGNDIRNAMKNQKPANTISVSAEGKITATPDLALATVGVTSQGTSAQDVQSKNNDKINKVIDFVKSQGVPKEDISTSQFYASPQYDYRSGTGQITGYQTTQTVTIKVRGVDKSTDKLNAILGGVTDNGANTFQGVSFSFDKPEDLQQDARKQAIDNAKTKAEELAAEAGLSLGKVVSISETGYSLPGPIPYARNEAAGLAAPSADMKVVAPTVEPGTQDITESMTVTFEVK